MAAPDRGRSRFRLSPRLTNLALLLTLTAVLLSGLASWTVGTGSGRGVVVGHGVAGLLVVALAPWKTRVARTGLGRRRASRWASLPLAVLAAAAVVSGVLHSTGLLIGGGDRWTMWWHVAFGFALVPLLVWHALARRQRPRRTDLTRRQALRAVALLGAASAAWLVVEGTTRLTGLPGARRRFTGSYPLARPRPTIWLADRRPEVAEDTWSLGLRDGHGARSLSLSELRALEPVTVRAVIDCTSGWYSEQQWAGVPLSRLVDLTGGRSVTVRSATGYVRRFDPDEAAGLLLAHSMAGRSLPVDLGAPLRLVAPGRRGYWWVKWVDGIAVDDVPAWWQPVFPLT